MRIGIFILIKYIIFILPTVFGCIDNGGSQLSINVQDSSDHAGDSDFCYPILTTSCNLRSAWFVCNSLCQEHDYDVSSRSSPSLCLIKLLHQSNISMNLTYGSLELNYNSSIEIDGNGAVIENHSEVSKSLFNYQNVSFNDEFANSYDSIIINGPYLMVSSMSIGGFHSNYGGAIFIDGSCNLTLTSITFRNNTAANSGGAIYINHNHYSSTIMNNTFMSCSASKDGGSIYIDTMNNEVMISNNVFSKSAGSYGGGISFKTKNKNIVMRENTFDNCRATVKGGGIMISDSNTQVSISSNSFNKCSSIYGGGLYFDQHVISTTIQHNNFTLCSASHSGGGMYFNRGNNKVIIHNNSFLYCSSYQSGCAITMEAYNTDFNITHLIVASCTINHPGTYLDVTDDAGGAIYLGEHNSHVSIVSSHFTNITSHTYGAIACWKYNEFIHIEGNVFERISLQKKKGNTAGSAILFLRKNQHLKIVGNEFVNLTAMYGGAIEIFRSNSEAMVQHNNFTNCRALIDGGGIVVDGLNHAMKFSSNLFHNCSANNSIGAMAFTMSNYDILIADSIFSHCHAFTVAGALYVGNSNYNFTLDYLLFDFCSSDTTAGSIYVSTNNSNILINNTKIINGTSYKYGGGMVLGLENTNINITYCSFIDNNSSKGGAIYFNKKNSNISFVGNSFQNNSADHGGACYFNEANDNILFIDEDSFKSIIVFNKSIPSGAHSFTKQFSHDNVSLVLFKFNPTSSDLINIDIKVDNETIYKDKMFKSRIFSGVSSPPLLLQPDLINISVYSSVNHYINVKFYLFPVVKTVNGSKNIFGATQWSGAPRGVNWLQSAHNNNNIFVNNAAIRGDGGAIYFNINNNFASILNTDFINNSAINGGAIHFGTLNPGSVLTNVLFRDNNCKESGGAIYFLTYNSGVQFYNVTFQSNTALMTGGAIHFELNNGIEFYDTANNEIYITSSKFFYNYANQSGGAIYSSKSNKLIIKDTEFTGNKASQGGGIMIIGKTNLTFKGSNDMKWNNATLGGALYVTQSYLYTCVAPNMLTIANNRAARGSGIYMDSIDLINNQNNDLTAVTFIGNYASVGGTIYWIYDSNSDMRNGPNIDNVIFIKNKANYGIEIATQGLEIKGPSSYEVTVYNEALNPAVNFEVVDFYNQTVRGDVKMIPTIDDSTNRMQCVPQNPYVSGINAAGLSVKHGYFSFTELEIFCYPRKKLQLQFQAESSLPEISGIRNNVLSISKEVQFQFRQCARGETIVIGRCVPCSNGTYSLSDTVEDSTKCIDCTQMEGVLSCHSNKIDVKVNHWRRHDDSQTVLSCFSYFDGCHGGYKTGNQSCKYGYAGPLCASCIEGYYSNGIQCIYCKDPTAHFTVAAIVYTCIGGFFFILFIAYLISKYVFKRNFLAYTKQSLQVFYSKVFVQVRILIVTYQVVGSIQYALIVKFPYLFSRLTIIISALFFDVSALFPIGCAYSTYTFVEKLYLWTSLPFAVTLIIVIMAVAEYKYKTRTHALRTYDDEEIFTKVKDKYLFYFFFLTYLILPSVTTSLFRMYICTNIDPNREDSNEYDFYLNADVRIPCYTKSWYNGVIYASIFIVIYPIGIPMMYLYLLSSCKEELLNRQREGVTSNRSKNILSKDTTQNEVSTVSRDTTNNTSGRHVIDSSVNDDVSLDDQHISSSNDPEMNHQEEEQKKDDDDDDDDEMRQSKSNNLSSHALCLSMLWEPYKNEYWYWEVIECYRRIILTSLVSIISPGSPLQSLSAILFTLFFIRLYACFLPYAVHSDNILAELGQAQVFATFFIALVINSSLLGNKWKYALDIILLTFNLSITALAVYFTFNNFDILKTIPSINTISVKSIRSLLTHAKDDDDGLKFTSFEDIDDHITADSHGRLMNDLNDYDLSSQRRDIFDFDLQDSPDPYIIVDDYDDKDDDDSNDGDDVHRKQTTQQDYLDSDYSLSSRFNTPYNVQYRNNYGVV